MLVIVSFREETGGLNAGDPVTPWYSFSVVPTAVPEGGGLRQPAAGLSVFSLPLLQAAPP